jgi:transposase-like protein
VIQLFAVPPDIGRVLYTTNAVESLHMQLRKIVKTRSHFSTPETAAKLLYLVLRNITKRRPNATHDWKHPMSQFAILYAERFTVTR